MTVPSIILATAASFALSALTPAKVSNVKPNPSAMPPPQAPAMIYVDSFSVSQTTSEPSDDDKPSRPHLLGRLRGGDGIIAQHKEKQQDETLAKLPGLLQKELVEDLNKSIAPAASGTAGDATQENSWFITGQFITVDPGSGVAQAGIGFGAGQSEVQVQAQIYAVSDMGTPFLVFDSKGASGHLPGAIVTKNPYVAIAKFVMSKKEPEKEAKKVAKSIAEAIGKFMASQGIPTLAAKKDAGLAPAHRLPVSQSSKGTPYSGD